MTAQRTGRNVKSAGRRASSSGTVDLLARIGLAARGVVYLLIGYLAVEIAIGKSSKNADRQGALQTVAQHTGGVVVLWVLAIGFAGLAIWRFTEAAYGQPGPNGHKTSKRLTSLARAVFYTVVCFSTVAFILGSGSSSSNDAKSKDYSGKAMHDIPAGRWLVLLVGLGFVAGGIAIGVKALKKNFEKRLKTGEMSRQVRKVVEALGMVGGVARGAVFAGAGALLAYAGITFDPNKAQGFDGTLRQFAKTPVGPWLLVVVALGLAVFGLYSFCEARWRRI
jgi:Domain of Unknown Function (DUF1206)